MVFEGFRETVIWFFIYMAGTLFYQGVSMISVGGFFYMSTAKLQGNPCSRHAICIQLYGGGVYMIYINMIYI